MTAMIRLQIVLLVLAPLLAIQIIQADTRAATTPGAGCGRPARSLDELRQLAEQGRSATPIMVEIAPTALPHGTPVDADTAGEIRTMLDELAACAMTGDTPRLYAYFSDHWLSSGFIGPQFIDQLVGATPTPVAAPNTIFVRDVTNVERLPDGRVGALVAIGGLCEQSQPQPTCVQYMGFVQQGGLWYVNYQITAIAGPHGGVTQLGQYLQEHGTPVATPAA